MPGPVVTDGSTAQPTMATVLTTEAPSAGESMWRLTPPDWASAEGGSARASVQTSAMNRYSRCFTAMVLLVDGDGSAPRAPVADPALPSPLVLGALCPLARALSTGSAPI